MIAHLFAISASLSGAQTPDSIQAKIELQIVGPKNNQAADMDLYFAKNKGTRLELSVFGFSAASALITDSAWTMSLPTENLVLRGTEKWIPLGDPIKAPWLNPENLVPVLWGDTSHLADVFRTSIANTDQTATYTTGPLQKCGDSLLCPKWVEFKSEGNKLRLEVVKREFKPKWKAKIWQWQAPENANWIQVPKISEFQGIQQQGDSTESR